MSLIQDEYIIFVLQKLKVKSQKQQRLSYLFEALLLKSYLTKYRILLSSSMGTLQSFTPLPQQTFRLLLYNPSLQLVNIIQSSTMKQKYRFETKIIIDFPLKQLLLKKTQKGRKKLKILIEKQKLIQISHFISIFHHQIIVIRKQSNQKQIKLNEQKNKLKFQQSHQEQQQIYNPFEVESLKLCISLSIHQLKLFNQILYKKQQKILSTPIKQQVNPLTNNGNYPLFRTSFTNKIITQVGQQIENIHIQQQNLDNTFQKCKRKNINLQQQICFTVPKILFSHHKCPYNPISLVLNNLPLKMIRKIMNLLLFYDTTFIRYPSLEIFFAAVCNSKSIICGPAELQQIVKRIEIEEFPFKQNIQSSFCIEQDSVINLHGSINPLFLRTNSKKSSKSEQAQIIYLYCFCKEKFQKDFRKYQQKMIEKLKDILIEIKFFTNILQLLKQLFKDQNKINQTQKINHPVSNKTKIDLINKLKSQKDTVFAVKQQENDKINSTNKEQNFSKTFQEYTSFLPDNKLNKKQSYLSPVKVQNNTKKQIVSSLSLNQINPQFHSLKKTCSTSHKGEKIIYPTITTVFFFIHEKQKDRYVIQSLSKKIGRQIKSIKIKKVLNFDQLGQKIQHQSFSGIVIKDDPKILQEFFNITQAHSIEDKIVVIKRSENDTQEVLVKKIMQVTEIGMIKLNRFFMFSHSSRKFIVIGSKPFLKKLMSNFPYLMIKEFVDVNLFQEHRKIRQVISRKNQFIISIFPICEICNQEYQGIIKAKIIYYNPQPNNLMCPLDTKQDCLCKQQNTFQPYASSFQKLTNRLQTFSFFSTSYPYENKKIWQSSLNLLKLFSKIKQKKYLINKLDKFEDQNEILFFCADSWVIEQITMTILKTFSSRYSGIFLCLWMKNRIIFECIQEVKKIVDFYVNSHINIHKGQISAKISRLIEQSKQIYRKMTQCLQQSQNLFDFSQVMLNLMIENLLFRKCLNYAWKSILSLNNHEYPLDCSTLFVVLILGFRRAGSMNRNDSISNGTFKSLFQFGSESSDSKQTCSVSIDNFRHVSKQKGQNNEGKSKNYQKEGKSNHPQNLFSQFKNVQKFNGTNTQIQENFIDQIIEKKQQKIYKIQTPKVYLKLSEFQKSQDQGSLRKFFISKNNVYTYIYTTQFLVFQTIDVSQINQKIPNSPQNKEKSIDKILQLKHNSPKSNYPPKLINYRQRRNDCQLNKFSVDQHVSKGNKKRNQKLIQEKKNNTESESPLNLAPLISNLFFFNHGKKQNSETETERQDFVLELKSCRNIQILPSTEDTLLICIENIQLLNYNLFIPYYRGRQKQKTKKHFILPPFTKLQINTNYKEKNPLGSSKSSLMTYQLKLSPDHQQRFLEKFIQNFLVQQSQYFQELTENQKIQMQTIFDPMLSTLKSEKSNPKMQDSVFYNKKNQQNSSPKFSRKIDNKVSQIKFIDERFQLPESDKFFILMNEFKYFSAHCLLIRSLPQSNMTNAYHAILLTRKGLYHEALKIINPSNSFRFSIQEYVKNLKKRLNEYFEGRNELKERKKNQNQKLMKLKTKKMKWKLNYEHDSQKFYLKQKNNEDHSFCYNDDSLDVVYKQVLTSIQHGIQNKSLERVINQKGQNKYALNSLSCSGNISNLKGHFRKQKKQSSIAINIEQSSDSQRINQWSQKMNINSSQIVSLETNKINFKQKELNQNSEKVQISPKNDQSLNSNGRRRSRISLCSSDFMFGNPQSFNKENSQKLSQENVTRFSNEKKNMNKFSNSLISNEQIDQIRSSVTSQSESSDQEIQLIRHKSKKSTSIQVKTRYKSNFFRQNAQQIKKCVEIFRKYQNQAKSQIFVTQKILQESSKLLTKQNLDVSHDKELQNKQRKQRQEVLNFIQDKVKGEDLQKIQVKQTKNITNPLKLFKNFKTQNKLEQTESISKNQTKACQSPIKINQKMEQNVDNNVEDNNEITNLIDMNLSGSFYKKSQIQNIDQQQLIRSKSNINQSENQQQNESDQVSIESQQFDIENFQDNENEMLQNSDMFGDQDKSKISFKFQSNQLNIEGNQLNVQRNRSNIQSNQLNIQRKQQNIQRNQLDSKDNCKKSKIKCKFTLDLSSESESNENSDIINKKQTNSQEIHSINLSQVQSNNEVVQDHKYENVIEKMFKDKEQNTKITDVKNTKSPYKIFYKDLSSSQSSTQSHNQLQLSQQNNKKNNTIFKKILKSPLNSNQHKQIKNMQQKTCNKDQMVCQQNKKDKLFNFTFKKKNLQNLDIQSNKSKIKKDSTLSQSLINREKEKQKCIVPKQNKNAIRKSKDLIKQDKNTFTFMKPVQQNSDQQVHVDETQQNMGLQKQQIEQFHTKLMNNSSIFFNFKQVPSFLASQLDLRKKVSNKKVLNGDSFENTDQQEQNRQSIRKDFDEYKVYPQELIEPQKFRNKQFQEQVRRQTITSKGTRTSHMIDFSQLKKLKLNCDIRRKR